MHEFRIRGLRVVVAIVAAIFCVSCRTSSAAQTYFSFTSTPGSWVGHGYLNYKITPEMGWTFSAISSPGKNYVQLSASRPRDPQLANYYWDLRLESSFAEALKPGLYEGATRYPFNELNEPGLTLSGNHRGNNRNTGYFRILEVDFGPGDTVNRFAVDFRQYDEGNPNNWVDGQFRYFATVPEPSSICMVAAAACLAFCAHRRTC